MERCAHSGDIEPNESLHLTAQIRQDLAAKQGEYNALMAKPNPDPKRAGKLNREITALHDRLRAKARSFNLPSDNDEYRDRMGGYGMMRGYGGCW